MATAISDPAELQELADLCAKDGIVLPGGIKSVEELVRYLLIAHKTKRATEAIRRERENRARLAKQRDGNPDAPDDDDDELVRRMAGAMQMSTGGDSHTSRMAKRIVDAQEAYHRSPNTIKNPFERA